MDCALSVSQVLTGTRPNMMTISARSFSTKPHVFFRNNLSPSISEFSNNVFCGTSKLHRSSQILGRHALVGPLVLAQRIFSDQAGKDNGGGKTTRIIISSEPAPFEASFALACVLGIFCFASMLVLSPRKAMANNGVVSGKLVLREYMEGAALFRSQPTFLLSQLLLSQPLLSQPETMRELKEQALMKLKIGMSHYKVVKQMKLAAEKIRPGPGLGSEEEYDFRMALVELLILQEKFNEAAEELKMITVKMIPVDAKARPSDQTRHSFYWAIIRTGLGEREKAKEAWEQFIKEGLQEGLPIPNDDK